MQNEHKCTILGNNFCGRFCEMFPESFAGLIIRERISNLGWSFFLQIFRQDNPYLSPWWTNLSEILYTSDLIIVLKSINIFANLVHQGLRYGVSDGTFVG